MNRGMGTPGSTRVWKAPRRSPPRYLTAPTSVIRESGGAPPVVSRSTQAKVTSCSGTPRSSKDGWIPASTVLRMARTVGLPGDTILGPRRGDDRRTYVRGQWGRLVPHNGPMGLREELPWLVGETVLAAN